MSKITIISPNRDDDFSDFSSLSFDLFVALDDLNKTATRGWVRENIADKMNNHSRRLLSIVEKQFQKQNSQFEKKLQSNEQHTTQAVLSSLLSNHGFQNQCRDEAATALTTFKLSLDQATKMHLSPWINGPDANRIAEEMKSDNERKITNLVSHQKDQQTNFESKISNKIENVATWNWISLTVGLVGVVLAIYPYTKKQ